MIVLIHLIFLVVVALFTMIFRLLPFVHFVDIDMVLCNYRVTQFIRFYFSSLAANVPSHFRVEVDEEIKHSIPN